MSSALFSFFLLSLLINPVLSDPVSLSFNDCFDSRRGNESQKLTVSHVYGQVIETSDSDSYLNLTVIGSANQELLDTRSDGGGNLATLFTTTTVLTLRAWSNSTRFCQSLRPPSPLPPPNNQTQLYCPISAGPFAFSSNIPWGKDRALTTLNTRLSAVDPFSQQLICLDVQTTPLKPDGEEPYGKAVAIFWASVALALAYWLEVGIARIVSAWNRGITRPDKGLWERAQSAGYILASAISGERFAVTPALLRFCTPSMRDVVFHTQWCAVLSMVAVQWPAFVYPLLTQTAWATLTYNVTLAQGDGHRWDPLSTPPYNPPQNFADQLADSQSPLFIDRNPPNRLFTLPDNATSGIASFAYTVGIRPEDLFSICLILFLGIVAATTALSMLIWFVDYIVCLVGGIVSGSHQGPTSMKLPGARSPGFSSRDMLDTVQNPNAEESKSLNGRELPGIIRPPSRFTLTAATTTSAPITRRWWRVRTELSGFHGSVLHGNLVRILVLFHLPVTIFSVYEMTLPRSNANTSLSTIVLAALSFTIFSVLIPAILVIRVRLTTTNKLYDETRTLLSLGPLYNHYGHGSQMFASMFFASNIAFGIVIGAGQKSGTAQAIVILVVEVVSALFTSIWLPWGTGASMGLISFLFCVARIVIAVLLVILTPAISIGSGPGGWVTYGILIILGLIYLALALMLVVKLMEAAVRIVGGISFDKSRHVVDSGLLGALGMLGCCGSRRHHRSRRSDKSKSRHKGSSAAGRSHRDSDISSYAPPTMLAAMNTGDSRKNSVHSGPPPSVLKPEHALRPYREESDDEAGFIMGAWQPFQNQPTGYLPVKETPPAKSSGFSRVGGGRAHIDSPYAITGGAATQSNTTFPSTERPHRAAGFANQSASSLPRSPISDDDSPPPSVSSPSALRQQALPDSLPPGAMSPFHVRTKSQTAIIEDAGMPLGMRRRDESSSSGALGGGSSTPPSRTTRLDSAPPPSSYRRSTALSEDERSSVDQPRKKPWYKLRRNRPHSSEGYSSRPPDEETPPEPLDVPPPSTTTPGKSFVVIRKGQASPGRSPQASGSGSRNTGEASPAATPTPTAVSFARE